MFSKRMFTEGRVEIPATALIILCSAFIAIVNNGALFSVVNERLDIVTLSGMVFVLSVYLLIIATLSILFFAVAHNFTLKPVLLFFLMLSSILSYFTQDLGVIFDTDMVRNVAETIRDNNQQEAFELMSISLITHLVLYGMIPALAVLLTKPVFSSFKGEVVRRLGYTFSMLALVSVMLMCNSKFSAFFIRENRSIRVYVVPAYSMYSLNKYVKSLNESSEIPFSEIGTDAIQTKISPNKTVGIMVVGETARADHFSLNGYARITNPLLSNEHITNFSAVNSAGTSTAYSVPSMFSFMEPKEYTPEKAQRVSNALDVLQFTGVDVTWIENNSSSKGVADRVNIINLRKDSDTSSPLYSDGGYFDEVMIDYIDACITQSSDDVLIVLHTMGSHGPTYCKRYPESFAHFLPDCQGNSPQECSKEEVINAYDNTILYTDYVVSQLIQLLKERETEFDSFFLYASDHGESLGEDGIYLHGLPAMLAPESQTHIPMIIWCSDGFSQSHALSMPPSITNIDTAVSHEYISHTLLNMFDVRTQLYKPELDLMATMKKSF